MKTAYLHVWKIKLPSLTQLTYNICAQHTYEQALNFFNFFCNILKNYFCFIESTYFVVTVPVKCFKPSLCKFNQFFFSSSQKNIVNNEFKPHWILFPSLKFCSCMAQLCNLIILVEMSVSLTSQQHSLSSLQFISIHSLQLSSVLFTSVKFSLQFSISLLFTSL